MATPDDHRWRESNSVAGRRCPVTQLAFVGAAAIAMFALFAAAPLYAGQTTSR